MRLAQTLSSPATLIGELDERGRAELAAALWERTRDTLLVVEPGTPAGYARIIALRAQLIANGAHVLAPCPHDKACPLVAPDWCHFAQRLPRSRDHMLMKDADVPFEDEKFSYVALSRDPGRDARRARACAAACRQGRHRRKALHGDGRDARPTIPRRDKAAYAQARRWRWGDAGPDRTRDARSRNLVHQHLFGDAAQRGALLHRMQA